MDYFFFKYTNSGFFYVLHTAHDQLYWITDAHERTPKATDAPVLLWMWLSSLPESRKGRLSEGIPCQWNRIFQGLSAASFPLRNNYLFATNWMARMEKKMTSALSAVYVAMKDNREGKKSRKCWRCDKKNFLLKHALFINLGTAFGSKMWFRSFWDSRTSEHES